MKSTWRQKESLKPVQSQSDFAIPKSLLEVLAKREMDTSDLEAFFSPKLSSLRDPFLLDKMDVAVERVLKAKKENQKICIYADFDLDGTSGLALFKTGLEKLGFTNLVFYQPKRLSEGYGLHASVMEELAKQDVRLVISIDVGITAIDAGRKAKEVEIDLIITDHHLAGETLPEAYAIINPNKPGCGSQLGHLSGAGVAFYFLWAIKREMINEGMASDADLSLKEVLDCFVIATLTDMVPLIAENRPLVKHGLYQLAHTKRPGLRFLLEELGFWGRPLSSGDVAIRFAPKLNALSRMEQGVRPLDLYLVEDETEAQNLVGEALRFNKMRLGFQADAEKEASEILKMWPFSKFVFVTSRNFHRGVVGLIAAKLSGQWGVPAFVGAESEDGIVVGSARRPDSLTYNLVEAIGVAASEFKRFGGHAAAAGFEFDIKNKDKILAKLDSFFEEKSEVHQLMMSYDAEIESNEITAEFMSWYERLGPFGPGFEAPVFRMRNLTLESLKELRGGHFRLTLRGRQGKAQALLFGPSEEQQFLKNATRDQLVEALVEPQWNYYEGNKSVQILIKDIRIQTDLNERKENEKDSQKEKAKESQPEL